MYTTENKNNFSIKNVILQFLFVALFIFILIWIFPLKSDLKKVEDKLSSTHSDFSVLYDRIFNENIISMKDSAKSYFTTPRLPQKVGDKVKMTLGEMLDKKIILPFTDKNGDVCDEDASYVEFTKYEDEFVLKVNLKCGKQENYLLVYMGCYDYCETALCEKNKEDIKTPIIYPVEDPDDEPQIKPEDPPKPTPQPVQPEPSDPEPSDPEPSDPQPSDPQPEQPVYITLYEYSKTISTRNEGTWSEWGTTKYEPINSDSLIREVEHRRVQVKKLVGYKVISKDDYSKPKFDTVTAVIGQVSKTYCSEYGYVATGEVKYTDWVDEGIAKFTTAPVDTLVTKYEKVGDYNWYCEGDCTSGKVLLYRIYTRKPVNVVSYECTKTNTVTTAITANKTVVIGYEKIEEKVPVYDITYRDDYRYKDTIITHTTDTRWSKSNNDEKLINDGYALTGNTKVIEDKNDIIIS